MATRKLLDLIHPGEILSEDFMKPMGISISKLARDIGVSPRRVSAIVNGKRAMTADTALRLARYFAVSSELWVGLQSDYDLRVAQRLVSPEIDSESRFRRLIVLNSDNFAREVTDTPNASRRPARNADSTLHRYPAAH